MIRNAAAGASGFTMPRTAQLDREILNNIRAGLSPFILRTSAERVIASLRKLKQLGVIELGERGWREVRGRHG